MLFAEDKNGNRIYAEDAIKEEQYYCPICHGTFILKAGDINIHHFAHSSGCFCDNWHYDMSEWHKKMQDCFPKENQEIIIEHNGKRHIADVCVDDIVIEFQHSPISAAEFDERNKFYMNAGFKLAWVFDFRDVFNSDQIDIVEGNNGDYFRWKHPMRIFQLAPKISDYSKDFSIWINGEMGDDYGNDTYYLTKIIWAAKDDFEEVSFSRFITSEYEIDLKNSRNVNEFFFSKSDWFNEELNRISEDYKYSVKIIGAKGYPADSYICPKTNKFGLQLFREGACRYCKYCAIMSHKKRQETNTYYIYCCYPNVVRTEEGHPGYECCGLDIYEI